MNEEQERIWSAYLAERDRLMRDYQESAERKTERKKRRRQAILVRADKVMVQALGTAVGAGLVGAVAVLTGVIQSTPQQDLISVLVLVLVFSTSAIGVFLGLRLAEKNPPEQNWRFLELQSQVARDMEAAGEASAGDKTETPADDNSA